MSNAGSYRSSGPELPGLDIEYFSKAFTHAEKGLRTVLDFMYVQSEDARDKISSRVHERLSACRFLGEVAGIPLPTPVMSEAEGALNIATEEEV